VTNADFEFDEIGVWSEIKLEIVEKYGSAYTTAFANSPNLTKFYIDAFSGAGVHISKRDGSQIEGSPSRALKIIFARRSVTRRAFPFTPEMPTRS